MNWKWLFVMDENPYVGNEPSAIGHYVFMNDVEAMVFLCEHKDEWLLLDVVANPDYKGDLDE